MKRTISILLVAAMLLSLAACSTATESNKDETSGSQENVSAVATPESAESSDAEDATPLPTAPLTDMEGENFNIYVHQWSNYFPLWITDMNVEEQTGEPFNDAAFNRNITIEDKLNCDVSMYEDTGVNPFITSQTAGDNAYDFIVARSYEYDTLISSKTITTFDNLPYFSPDSLWWDAQSYDSLSIGGHHLGVVGDITSNSYLALYGIFFNKDMVTDYNLGDIYQTVRDGKWTLDLMFDYCSTAARDLNGDNEWTTDDQIGFSYVGGGPIAMLNGFGINLAEVDEEGKIVVKLNSEDAFDKCTKLLEYLKDDAASLNHHSRSDSPYTTEVGCFVQGRVLFNQGSFYYAPEVRAMDQEFGIIPMPKYDENQEKYLAPVGADYLSLICIPKTCTDFEKLSTFMEWYAYYGFDTIRPELMEVLIQGKVARDVESIEFIDYICENKAFDIGATFNFGGLFDTMVSIYKQRAGSFATIIPRLQNKIDSGIQKLEEAAADCTAE